uniref:Uncharacterized protein n=1 Tax=Chaetoceros debilis TaxID=122233 RepID=A0A7S3V9S5_9STRA|eukprot:CAMPEP_0194107246 /NCGR_PEP_ID=MMETSP0150-20130528/7128_1 /TAXON_ID=122233 /ORGANISM="Chaetoceros debilis, Strain MM31A-1" /LENGTH=1746 /DNA_ID=CAMNT_0038795579 /DNA_START=91 /DNA_END=5331 /DNA_ORIENTATION=+
MGNSTSKPRSGKGKSKSSSKAKAPNVGIGSHPFQKDNPKKFIDRAGLENDDASSASSFSSDEYLEPKVMFPESPPTPEERQSSNPDNYRNVSGANGRRDSNGQESQTSTTFSALSTLSGSATTIGTGSQSTLNHDMIHRSAEVFEPHTTRSSLSYSTNGSDASKTVEFTYDTNDVDDKKHKKKGKRKKFLGTLKKMTKNKNDSSSNRLGCESRSNMDGGSESGLMVDTSLDYYRQMHYKQQQAQKAYEQMQLQLEQQESPRSWSEVASAADDPSEIHSLRGNGVHLNQIHSSNNVATAPPVLQATNTLCDLGRLPTILDESYVSSTADTTVDERNGEILMDILNETSPGNIETTNVMLGDLTGEGYFNHVDDENEDAPEDQESFLRYSMSQDDKVDESAAKMNSNISTADESNRNDDHNFNDDSMFTTTYEESDGENDDHVPFSCTKDASNLDYTDRMNSFLDKNHGSYVEGDTVHDIATPTARLGDLFDDMNLTRNKTFEGEVDASRDEVDESASTLFRTSISVSGNTGISLHDFECQGTSLDRSEGTNADTEDGGKALLDQTDMAVHLTMNETDIVQESNLDETILTTKDMAFDRTDMAIEEQNMDLTNSNMFDMLNQDEEEKEEDSPTRPLKDCDKAPNESFFELKDTNEAEKSSDDSTLSSFQPSINQKVEKKEKEDVRINSPVPPSGRTKVAPTTAKVANLLPERSDDNDTEEDGLIFGTNDEEREKENLQPFMEGEFSENMFQSTKGKHVQNQMPIPLSQAASRRAAWRANAEKKPSHVPIRGPEIGTVIKIFTKADKKKDDCDSLCITGYTRREPVLDSDSQQSRKSTKLAFTKQAETNSTFLFSDDAIRIQRQAKTTSKVDQQRLSLIDIEEASKRISSQLSTVRSGDSSTKEEPFEIIKRLAKLKGKGQNVKESFDIRNQAVSISKDQGEYTIQNKGVVNKLTLPVSKNMGSENVQATTSTISVVENRNEVQEKIIDDEYEHAISPNQSVDLNETSASHMLEKVDTISSLGKFLSPRKKSLPDDNSSTRSEVTGHDSLAEILDELSVTDLQKKYSAITPMKTKSPYVRFKKAFRVFENKRSRSSSMTSNARRKSSPKKNASAHRVDFVVRSVKKARHSERTQSIQDTNQQDTERRDIFSVGKESEPSTGDSVEDTSPVVMHSSDKLNAKFDASEALTGITSTSDGSSEINKRSDPVHDIQVKSAMEVLQAHALANSETDINSTEQNTTDLREDNNTDIGDLSVVNDMTGAVEDTTSDVVQSIASNSTCISDKSPIGSRQSVASNVADVAKSAENPSISHISSMQSVASNVNDIVGVIEDSPTASGRSATSDAESDEQSCSSPYDEHDELSITPSSSGTSAKSYSSLSSTSVSSASAYSESTEDDIFADLRNNVESPNASLHTSSDTPSSENDTNILRSAMKKKVGSQIKPNRVSWHYNINSPAGGDDESSESPSPVQLELYLKDEEEVQEESNETTLSPVSPVANRFAAADTKGSDDNSESLVASFSNSNGPKSPSTYDDEEISIGSLSTAPPLRSKNNSAKQKLAEVFADAEEAAEKVSTTITAFGIYSPAGESQHESLMLSPAPVLSKTTKSAVNPMMMNARSNASGRDDNLDTHSNANGSDGGTSVYSPAEKENLDNNIYSPTNDSQCSYSPLQMSSKKSSAPGNHYDSPQSPVATKASTTHAHDLCLSPVQRTPMQARKWRTLAAQASSTGKKKSKSSSKKKGIRTPLGKLRA